MSESEADAVAGDTLAVMIVDDEHLVRQLLRNSVDWNALGFRIAAVAEGAQEALQLAQSESPDVAIVDINMPIMDGIRLAEILTERFPRLKIIILTGYEQFEYAQSSVKLGIADFLTKPIIAEELSQSLLRVREKIESERNRDRQVDAIKAQLAENMPYARERFLTRLLLRTLEPETLSHSASYYGLELSAPAYRVAVAEVESLEGGARSEEAEQVLRLRALNHMRQTLGSRPGTHVFFDTLQRIVILDPRGDAPFAERCEAQRALFARRDERAMTIGIGSSHPGVGGISDSYREACEALKFRIVAGKNQVIGYDEIIPSTEDRRAAEEGLDNLRFFVSAGLGDRAADEIHAVCDRMRTESGFDVARFRVVAVSVVSHILAAMRDDGIPTDDVFGAGRHPFEEVVRIDTLPEMRAYLLRIVSTCVALTGRKRSARETSIVDSIREYLLEHLADFEVSLQSVARAFRLNPSYLSRLFKQKTGVSFIEYLTDARVRAAEALLRESDLKIYQIAEKVGMIDPHYLGVCFRKIIGSTMSDYKKSLHK